MQNKIIIFDWGGVIESHDKNELNEYQTWHNILKKFNISTSRKEIINKYEKINLDENNNHIGVLNSKDDLEKWIKRLQKEWKFSCSVNEFINNYQEEFSKIYYYQDVVSFIHDLKNISNTKVGLLSNLMMLDKKRLDQQVDLNYFDYVFLSFEIGMRKPFPKIYEYVEKICNVKPENIMFIDDDTDNIKQAIKRGWNVCQATGHELNKIKYAVYNFLDIKQNPLQVEKLDHFARGIAYIDGKIVFIDNTLPGEEVEIKITKETKKYIEGKVTKYHKLSEKRIKERCPYYHQCGGCNLQHLTYQEENNYKKDKVVELITKFTNINEKIIFKTTADKDDDYYRNKILLHGEAQNLGYYKEKSNELLPITYCPLATKRINELLESLTVIAKTNEIEEAVIRTSNNEDKIMLKLTGKITNYVELLPLVDVLLINNQKITVKDHIITTIGNKKFHLSIDSFFQINKNLTEKLYDEALAVVKEKKPNKVLDLYCGTGTIGIYISEYVTQVIGVDSSKAAITNANQNKILNNTTNITFINSKVENVIDQFKDNIDLIIVDPPRCGLDKKTVDNIIRINPKDLIYISCDPVTLARDLNILQEHYDIKVIKPYNMFPRTYHVECISVLERKNVEK